MTIDLPDLIPSRMVNEFVYCPRLCYLEWVDQRWEPSEDTAEGAFHHRSVDAKGGVLPKPEAAEAQKSTFSVSLSDVNWGLTGVIDRVDQTDVGTIPVDIKKGHPRPDGTPWPADRVQALCQAALLEASGYTVHEAHLFYAEDRRPVQVPWDAESRQFLRETLEGLRVAMLSTSAPLPLVDDSRCPRCSLAGLCLPDELNALLHRSEAEPRRILPRNPDAAPLYVVEQGAVVGVKGGRVRVSVRGEVRADVRLIDVLHLCVLGHVQVTTEALTRLWSVGASVVWLSTGGWLNGWSQAHPGKYVDLRRRSGRAKRPGRTDRGRDRVREDPQSAHPAPQEREASGSTGGPRGDARTRTEGRAVRRRSFVARIRGHGGAPILRQLRLHAVGRRGGGFIRPRRSQTPTAHRSCERRA